jgi:tripartite-type tricarboxylate transporter receptor subunit TctC
MQMSHCSSRSRSRSRFHPLECLGVARPAVRTIVALSALATATALLAQPLPALSQSSAPSDAWPSRPIRILLPVGAGGVTDINARLLAQRWSTTLGQSVLIDNRPGAGGIVATELVKNAIPDGHTLLWLNSGHAVATAVMKSLPYDAVKDFEPVSTIAYFAQALVVGGDSPIKSVSGLVAAAKANPRKVSIGMTNIGSTPHVTAELFRSMGGFEAELVPYKTSGALIAAARTGEASVIIDFIAPVLSLAQSGSVRVLAVTSTQRFPGLPAVPTVAEAGLPGFEATAWNGLAGPAKTPRPVIERLHREIHSAIAVPEIVSRLRELGIEVRGSTPDGMRKLMVEEIDKWRRVVATAKIERQ